MIFTNIIFNTTFSSHQLCTLSCTSCLSKKLKKQDLKHFLVTDIINIIIYFGVRTTYNYSQDLLKLYHKDNHTHRIYIICTYYLN